MNPGGDAVAVVLATTPAADLPCPDGASLLERLTRQLVTLPVRDVHVVARPDGTRPYAAGPYEVPHRLPDTMSDGLAEDLRVVAKTARTATSPVIVLVADVVAHTEALATLVAGPSRLTGAIVGPIVGATAEAGERSPLHPPVRTESGRVVSAGNSFHEVERADGVFGGVLQVGEAHLTSLAEVAEELADLAERRRLGRVSDAEVPDLLLAGLVRSGVPVRSVTVGALRCDRVADSAGAEMAISGLAGVDESRARLDAAVKTGDGFFTTFFVSSWSRHLVRLAAMLGLTPNAVTGISVGLALIAAIWFSDGHRTGLVVGAVALYLSFVLDCVDGQLARYTRRFSTLGGWLDGICDRLKEYVVLAGLAFGYQAQSGEPGGVWPLAVAAVILQVVRHMVDFSYAGAVADSGAGHTAGPRRPLAEPRDGPRDEPRDEPRDGLLLTEPRDEPRGGPDKPVRITTSQAGPSQALPGKVTSGEAAASVASPRARSAAYWLRKIIVLPIGERMALIAITAALFDARVTFLALLGWGVVALAYMSAGRIRRSFG
ncbi:CDP-alcohol phosphatidyltransferase family protein [Sphaerimonospora cavernae]|uniref:CDP-alcohol phosphatidyltransferase family protein n=1 Tax=Sphaerimonospora cavernae TaxID=1740611 RepID=A0ABV6U9X1_9ACTN